MLGCGGLKPFARIMITSRTLTIDDVPAGGRAAAGRPSRPHTSLFERPEAPIVAALLVAVLTVLALTTSRSAGLVAALWAPAGLAVAAWLRGGRSARYDWAFGGLLAAGFAAGNLLAGNTVLLTAMFTVANMIDVIAAVALVRRFAPRLDFNDARSTARFLVLAGGVAPLPAALFTAACLSASGASFGATFETWWFGHALSIAIIAPFILSLRRQTLSALRDPFRVVECVLLLGATAACALMVFTQQSAPLPFLLTPLMILVAARLRVAGASAAILIVAVIAILATMFGHGPMQLAVDATPAGRVALAQLFLLMGCLPALLVAALLQERDTLAGIARADQLRAEAASEGKSRLLANVAHEIKSPIGGIIGIGELWAGGKLGPVSQTQAEMSDMLVKTARQVETLAHDLLDVARAESGAVQVDLRSVDIPGLIEDVKRAVALQPEARNLRLETVSEGENLVAVADSVRLSQVLGNLATNAVKYAASGGVVIFRVLRAGDAVRIEVIDRGPGLTPEKQAQLFEPFNRLGMERSAIEGHGIGLALAKRLVELQRGRIGVISAAGEGAMFWVELPAA